MQSQVVYSTNQVEYLDGTNVQGKFDFNFIRQSCGKMMNTPINLDDVAVLNFAAKFYGCAYDVLDEELEKLVSISCPCARFR